MKTFYGYENKDDIGDFTDLAFGCGDLEDEVRHLRDEGATPEQIADILFSAIVVNFNSIEGLLGQKPPDFSSAAGGYGRIGECYYQLSQLDADIVNRAFKAHAEYLPGSPDAAQARSE
jgi:hypothetical protein